MGSSYGMMKRNLKLSHAFEQIAAHPDYNKKCGISRARAEAAEAAQAEAEAPAEDDGSQGSDSEDDQPAARKQADYLEFKKLFKSEQFQQHTQALIDFVRPVMRALRVADQASSQHSIVWDTMAKLDEHYAALVDDYDGPIPARASR